MHGQYHSAVVPGFVTSIGAPRSNMSRIALCVSSLPSPVMTVGEYRLVPFESVTTNDPLKGAMFRARTPGKQKS